MPPSLLVKGRVEALDLDLGLVIPNPVTLPLIRVALPVSVVAVHSVAFSGYMGKLQPTSPLKGQRNPWKKMGRSTSQMLWSKPRGTGEESARPTMFKGAAQYKQELLPTVSLSKTSTPRNSFL